MSTLSLINSQPNSSLPGRQRQVFDILSLFQSSQLIGLIGEAGTGKTTLITKGVIPELERGFLGNGGKSWKIVNIRPGITPIENLCAGFSRFSPGSGKEKLEEEFALTKNIKTHQDALLQACKNKLSSKDGLNYLLVIDNFEDLFQFGGQKVGQSDWDKNVLRFIQNISKCVLDGSFPLYFLLVLRSEYVSHIFDYRNFHDKLSKSQYSLPQFRKTEFQEIVAHQLAPSGINIFQGGVDALYNKLGRDLKNLSLLKWCLGNLIDECKRIQSNQIDVETIQLIDFERIYEERLERFFNSCSPEEQQLLEKLFRQVTINLGNIGEKRGISLEELLLVLGTDMEQLTPFLVKIKNSLGFILEIIPPYHERLEDNQNLFLSQKAIISIKNDFYIPQWPRLMGWIEQERLAQEAYKRLSESAQMHDKELTGYLRPPDLDYALNWYKTYQPDEHWAAQFDDNFHKTMEYLRESQSAFEEELRLKEDLQKEKIKRVRKTGLWVLVASLLITLVIIGFAIDAKNQEKEARIAKEKAERERERAKLEKERADILYLEARNAMQEAFDNEQLALQEKSRADQASQRANYLRLEAESQRTQIENAFQELDQKSNELGLMVNELQVSDSLKTLATKEAESARAYQVAINKILTLRSNLQKDDILSEKWPDFLNELSSIYQAYRQASFDFKGLILPNDDLFQVLMNTRSKLIEMEVLDLPSNNLASLPNGIRDLKLSASGYLAAGGDDGVLLYTNQPYQHLPVSLQKLSLEKERIRSLEFIKNTELLIGTVSGKIFQANLITGKVRELKISGLNGSIIEKLIIEEDKLFVLQGGKLFTISLQQPEQARAVTNLSASNIFKFDDRKLLIISNKSELVIIDQVSLQWQTIDSDLGNKSISTAVISGDEVIFGMDNGDIIICQMIHLGNYYNLSSALVIPAHFTRITGLAYNKASQKLYTASLDQRANIIDLNLRKLGKEYILNHAIKIEGFNKWIWGFQLVQKNSAENIFTIDENGDLKFWQSNTEALYQEIFENLKTGLLSGVE